MVVKAKRFEETMKRTTLVKIPLSIQQYTTACDQGLSAETCKGTYQKRFSGFRPLRGYPPPIPLTENQCEKRRIFSLTELGGTPPP